MKKRRIICIGLYLILCGCWWTLSKEKLVDKLDQVQQQLRDFEVLIGSDDEPGRNLLAQCGEQLENVPDLIVENEFEQADRIIEKVALRLERFAKKLNRKKETFIKPIVVFGEAEYQSGSGSGLTEMTGDEDPRELQRIRTDIRSAVLLKPFSNVSLTFPAQSDILIGEYDKKASSLRLSLQEGGLSLSKTKGGGRIDLEMDGFQAAAKGSVELQMLKDVITHTSYLAVYDGHISWREGGLKGRLGKYTGLQWKDGVATRVEIPVKPRLDAPLDYQTLVVPRGGAPEIAFRWYFPLRVYQHQVQVSDHPLFVTRIHDQTAIADNSASFPLEAGIYYWRVRGVSLENVPGPFSRTSRLTVKYSKAASATAKRRAVDKGPAIVGLALEIINDMVIVSGRSISDARVSVNGSSAVMMDNGGFRAVLTFPTEGEHDIRIIATNTLTGAETIQERRVIIQF